MGSLTDVPRATVEGLVESLHHDMVVVNNDGRPALAKVVDAIKDVLPNS